MRKVIYRFHAYNNIYFPHRFVLRKDNISVEVMGWARFIDLCLDSIHAQGAKVKFDHDDLLDADWEEIFVDMDRLQATNYELYQKILRYLEHFDDFNLTPTMVFQWLDELEDFCCAKVVSIQ
jgi:hypothetical protein